MLASSVNWDDIYANLSQSQPLEKLNAYKVCVLFLVEDYVKLIFNEKRSISNENRLIACTLIKLIQKTNETFEMLVKTIHTAFSKEFCRQFCHNLDRLRSCFDAFLSFLKGAKDQTFDTVDCENKIIVEKQSVVGHFVRRTVLTTEKSTFTDLTLIWNQLKKYVGDLCSNETAIADLLSKTLSTSADIHQENIVNDESPTCSKLNFNFNGSKADLQKIVKRQIALLQVNCSETPNHATLDQWIARMRKKYPDCYELFFLKYLNADCVGDFLSAETALHEYFDWSAVALNNKDRVADTGHFAFSKALRYGPLLLAQLNRKYGHRSRALAYLKECIEKSQESNDLECLQYALAEYCILMENDDCSLYDLYNVSLKSSRDLNLQNVYEKTQLSRVLMDFRFGNSIIQSIDALQSEVAESSGRFTIFYPVILSSLYLTHGLVDQCALEAQKFLHSNRFCNAETPGNEEFSEFHCLAMCNLTYCHVLKGNIVKAKCVVKKAKELFSMEASCSHLIMCDAYVGFTDSLYKCAFDECQQFLTAMSSVSLAEATLKCNIKVWLKMILGDIETVAVQLNEMLNDASTPACLRCRIYILLTDYYIYFEKNSGLALHFANVCKSMSSTCEFQQIYAIIQRRFSLIMMMTDNVNDAIEHLEAQEATSLMYLDQMELGKHYFTKAKCLLLLTKNVALLDRGKAEIYVRDIDIHLQRAFDIFHNSGQIYLEKETCYMLAIVHHERTAIDSRNRWSKKYKELEGKVSGHFPFMLL